MIIWKNSRFLILLLLNILVVGSVILFFYRKNPDFTEYDKIKIRNDSRTTAQVASNRGDGEDAAVNSKKGSRSVQEWMTWLRSEGGWQLDRSDSIASFKGDKQAFKEIGISSEGYDQIFGRVNSAVWAVWGGSPNQIHTEGDTTVCVYEGNPALKYVYTRFIFNLKQNLEGMNNGPVDPRLLEAIVNVSRQEPILRNFGLAKLETTFQDMVQDGQSIFRIVEKLYDDQGTIVTQTEYMSSRIPEPYNTELWIEEEK